MTFDPNEPLPTDYVDLEDMLVGLRELGQSHPEMFTDEATSREAAQHPDAIRAVMRYHGEGHDFAQRMMRHVTLGRGVCCECGHAVYYDDREEVAPYFPNKLMCLVCLMAMAAAAKPDAKQQALEDKLLGCPPDCRFTAASRRDAPTC